MVILSSVLGYGPEGKKEYGMIFKVLFFSVKCGRLGVDVSKRLTIYEATNTEQMVISKKGT